MIAYLKILSKDGKKKTTYLNAEYKVTSGTHAEGLAAAIDKAAKNYLADPVPTASSDKTLPPVKDVSEDKKTPKKSVTKKTTKKTTTKAPAHGGGFVPNKDDLPQGE